MTAKIERVNRICGVIRNLSLLLLIMFWGVLGELGVYRTTIGSVSVLVVTAVFIIAEVIRVRKKKYQNSKPESCFLTEEDISELDQHEIEKRITNNEETIKKNEKNLTRDRIMLAICFGAEILAILFAVSLGYSMPDIICSILLVWPAFQISKGIKFLFYRKLSRSVIQK